MRRPLLGLVLALGISAVASEARAQNFNDPIFQYYSFYLPRQQAQSLQPGPEATINAVTANRQQYAATNRNGMFDPFGSSSGSLDSGDDFTTNAGARRRSVSTLGGRYGVHGGNLNGLGPQGYYNSKLNTYYRDLRAGRGRNSNVPTIRSRGYSGMGMGLPGPR